MKFIVSTQGLENYGAHQESGKFADGQNYWKFKGGTDYEVSGLERPQDAMAFVAAFGIDNGIGWKEFPTEVQSVEEWEAQFHSDFDTEYLDFKREHLVKVDPKDPETYKRFLSR